VTLHIPIGIDDFRTLRERDLEYIDKPHLICELVDWAGVEVVLLPRPRRFGKSLNLSMLRWFFEKRDEDLWPLFDGLHIARAGQAYRAHFQRYPVVYVSFKATRADRFEDVAKNYAAELHAAGAGQVHALVVAFDGKRVRVESADAAVAAKGASAKKRGSKRPSPDRG